MYSPFLASTASFAAISANLAFSSLSFAAAASSFCNFSIVPSAVFPLSHACATIAALFSDKSLILADNSFTLAAASSAVKYLFKFVFTFASSANVPAGTAVTTKAPANAAVNNFLFNFIGIFLLKFLTFINLNLYHLWLFICNYILNQII